MVVTYDNGAREEVDIRNEIPKGGESRNIDLRGSGKRSLKQVEFWYDTQGHPERQGRGQARSVCGDAGDGSPTCTVHSNFAGAAGDGAARRRHASGTGGRHEALLGRHAPAHELFVRRVPVRHVCGHAGHGVSVRARPSRGEPDDADALAALAAARLPRGCGSCGGAGCDAQAVCGRPYVRRHGDRQAPAEGRRFTRREGTAGGVRPARLGRQWREDLERPFAAAVLRRPARWREASQYLERDHRRGRALQPAGSVHGADRLGMELAAGRRQHPPRGVHAAGRRGGAAVPAVQRAREPGPRGSLALARRRQSTHGRAVHRDSAQRQPERRPHVPVAARQRPARGCGLREDAPAVGAGARGHADQG